MTDGFIFYASFYDALSDLDDDTQLQAYRAICGYALTGEEPELTGAASAVFKLVQPQIDANARRRENGKRGGKPKQNESKEEVENNQTETEDKPNHNQIETKAEPKEKDKVKVKEKVKEKDKEKDKEKEKHRRGELGEVLLTDKEFEKLGNDLGVDMRDACITFLDQYIAEKGYKSQSHNLAIRRWVATAVEERRSRGKPRNNITPMMTHNEDYDDLMKRIVRGG